MIEDVEEYILGRLLAAEKLNVINDQHVHHLIEVTEVIDRIVSHGVNELMGESFRAHIKHRLVRLTVFDLESDGVSLMRFPQSHATINQEWVESSTSRFVCDSESCTARQPVALAFDKVLESVVGVEVGIKLSLRNLESRTDS